jgi:hypothetical protein
MKETLHDANGLDQTRVKRAFGWIITFRDFPVGCHQVVGGDAMMTEALTLFTKGRAEFYLDGERRGDRIPGILSSEHELVGLDGTFTLRYVEPTTRLCVPASFNRGRLPTVQKLQLQEEETVNASPGDKYLVCLGKIAVKDRTFSEEQSFQLGEDPAVLTCIQSAILLKFLD